MFYLKIIISFIFVIFPIFSKADTLTHYPQLSDKSNKAVVLMYHRISHKKSSMTLQPESFDQEMSYLHDNHYNVISSMTLVDAIRNKKELPKKSVVITFDDGWESQLYAMKTLQKYHYPATFALITECADKHGYIRKTDMDFYKNEDFLYVNHSRTHDVKDFLNNPDYDVPISKKELYAITQKFVPIYVYPYGSKNNKLVEDIKKNGYIAAFGVNDNVIHINNTNIYNMNRYLINDKITIHDFQKIVSNVD